MIYFKKFSNITGYAGYAYGDAFIAPNISAISDSGLVMYNRTQPESGVKITVNYNPVYDIDDTIVITSTISGLPGMDPTGTATLSINGTQQTKSVSDLSFNISISNLGTYPFTLTYNGDSFYDSASTNGSFEVTHDFSLEYLTIEIISAATGAFLVTAESGVYFSKNGEEWDNYYSYDVNAEAEYQDNPLFIEPGDKIRIKNSEAGGSSSDVDVLYFNDNYENSVRFNVYGNIMSLYYGDDFVGMEEIQNVDLGRHLFDANIINGHPVSARNLVLPATTLYSRCYSYMFANCSFLTDAPKELPATTLADNCYESMFYYCYSLTGAPISIGTSQTEMEMYSCYNMFYECSGLTIAPELPATTLADGCYCYMFDGCTGLTTAPELPATTLASSCYQGMFQNCTGLTTAPELPATTLASGCYESMFYGCSSLNYIKCLATDISEYSCTSGWVYDVAQTGTFVKDSTMEDWEYDNYDGVPTGWTIVDAS